MPFLPLFVLFLSVAGFAQLPTPYELIETSNLAPSNPGSFTAFNGDIYFAAEHVLFGRELWVLRAGEERPRLFEDLAPGEGYGVSGELLLIDGRLYYDSSQGLIIINPDDTRVWTGIKGARIFNGRFYTYEDGILSVVEGETTVSLGPFDLFAGETQFVDMGDDLFAISAVRDRGFTVSRLGESGFEEVTLFIEDENLFGPGPDRGMNMELIPAADRFYMLIDRGNDGDPVEELWVSDGTAQGTKLLSSADDISAAAVLGDTLYFLAPNEVNNGLWMTDGTPEGTRAFTNLVGLHLSGLSVVNDTLLLHANSSGLLRFTGGGYEQIGDFRVFSIRDELNDNLVLPGDGYAYGFASHDSRHHLMRTDGTVEGTVLVAPLSFFPETKDLAAAGDRVLLGGEDEPVLVQDGAMSFLDINPDTSKYTDGAYEANIVNGKLYYITADTLRRMDDDASTPVLGLEGADLSGFEIFSAGDRVVVFNLSDQTAHLLGDTLEETQTTSLDFGPNTVVRQILPADDRFFLSVDVHDKFEVWVADGNLENLTLVDTITPLPFYFEVESHDDRLYYMKQIDDAFHLISAGGPGDVVAVAELLDDEPQSWEEGISEFRLVNGALYFALEVPYYDSYLLDWRTRTEWHRTDGTAEGTYPDPDGIFPILALSGGNFRLFDNDNHWGGATLYRYPEDGSREFFVNSLDARHRWAEHRPVNGNYAFPVIAFGNLPMGFYITDGTMEGTRLIYDFEADFDMPELTFLGQDGSLIYFAEDIRYAYNRYNLWACNMESDSLTMLARDLNLGEALEESIVFDGHLFFRASDEETGQELWQSDGTPEGTISLDLNPGRLSAQPSNLTVHNDVLWLRAWAEDGYWYWWRRERFTSTEPLDVSILAPSFTVGSCPASAYARGDTANAEFQWTIQGGVIVGPDDTHKIRYRALGTDPVTLSLTVTRGERRGEAQTDSSVILIPFDPCGEQVAGQIRSDGLLPTHR
ncbi:MAG: hypothetical protein QNK37_02125 [Acidobacteriota bacterium]|nr:hypothetical protein [Acidobacteriota bacterium]